MSKVVDAVSTATYAALSMDTGTGKTLSLLCPILSLIKDDPSIQLIYASRTHSQLQQVKKELRKTVFADLMTSTHIASRDHYCMEDSVRSNKTGDELNTACQLNRGRCRFFKGCKNTDIEDVRYGLSHKELMNHLEMEDFKEIVAN